MTKDQDYYIHGSHPEEQERLTLLNTILNRDCLDVINIIPGERILDVGAGLGHLSRAMARLSGTRVLGIERDVNQIAVARQYALEAGESELVEFREGNIYDSPASGEFEGAFDLVHCRFVLEHILDPQAAVYSMLKAVRSGGRLFLMDDDHSLLRLNPDVPEMDIVWEAYCKSYTSVGNDPYIGRKLVSLLDSGKVSTIRQGVVFFGSWHGNPRWRLYVDNILGILQGAADAMLNANLLSSADLDNGLEAFENWSRTRHAAIWYPLNWAEGRKG